MKRQRPTLSLVAHLFRLLLLPVLFLAAPLASIKGAPNVTATKDDNTAPGVRKNVGNNIDYTVTIGNSGGTTATAVVLTDPTPANTILVAPSLNATPLALNDTYPSPVIANTSINTATSGFSVVTNDFAGYSGGAAVANTALTITAFDAASTGGGTVNMVTSGAGVGQFTYTPAAGFTGTDTFTYTINNGVTGGTAASVKATVSIVVGGPVVWFVNPNSGTNGNGTLASPFNNLASAVSAIGANANHRIFIYSGGGNQGAIALNSGGWLVGQAAVGATFDALMGITYPTDTTLARPSINNASKPTLAGSSGTVITLGSGNTVAGVNVTNSAGNGISGSAVGTLTLADFTVTVTGGTALSVTTSGTVTATGTANTLNSTNGTALNVANTIIGASGLTFRSITAGTAAGSAGVGISLNTTGPFGGLTVTGNGTPGSGGSIQHKTGADGSTTSGIGIYLSGTSGVSLSWMQLNDFDNFAIRGTSVAGFSLINSTINGNSGTTEAGGSEEGAIRFDGLSTSGGFAAAQTATISGCTISGSYSDNLRILNTSAGSVLDRITIDSCTFGLLNDNGTHGGNNIVISAASGATLNFTFTNSLINGARGQQLIATCAGGGHMDAVVRGNRFYNTDTNTLSGGGGVVLGGGDLGVADFTFDVSYNRIKTTTAGGAKGAALNIFKATNSTGGSFAGSVKGNAIGVVGTALSGAPNSAPAIWVQSHGVGTCTVLIRDNNIVEYGEEAIDLQGTQGSGTLNASVFNNTVTPNAANAFCGLNIEQGALGTDTGIMNIVVGSFSVAGDKNDFSTGDPTNFSDIQILRAGSSSTVLNLSKNGSSSATPTLVLQDDNIGGALTAVGDFSPGNRNLVTTLPTLPPVTAGGSLPAPLMFAEGGVERAGAGEMVKDLGVRTVASPFTAPGVALPAVREASLAVGHSQTVPAIRTAASLSKALTAPEVLTQAQLDSIVSAAMARWEATGLTADQLATLRSLKFEVTNLPGTYLGEANGTRIRVDDNAGGNGWHVDASAAGDALFGTVVSATRRYTDPTGAPAGRIDLLTVVLHEMGHSLGLDDSYLQQQRDSLMYGFLTKGERRLPAANQAIGAVPHADGVTHFLAAPLNIGDLPAGKSVIVTYSVTITGAAASISNQGTVSGGNFANVLTDDPDFPGAADATITPLAVPPTSFSAQTPPAIGDVGLAYAGYTFIADGIPAPTYSVQSGTLPNGLTLSSAGLLSGTPTASGTFSGITVRATNVAGFLDTVPFTITIAPAVTVSPATMPNWTVNAGGYSQTFVGSNGTGAKTLSVSAGAIPTGMTFVPATGVLSGTPTATGTFNFTLAAIDTLGQFATQAYTVVINAAVTVAPASLPNWTVNKAGYSQTVTSANGTGTRTLSISAGAIPTGMTFTPGTGVLDGTPTAAGTFNFTVTSTDSVSATGSQAYTIVINPAITVSPATLPNAQLNASYSQTVGASGGTGAKTFGVTAGSLPTGLSLAPATGAITGTATANGTFNFTITATDTVGATGSQAYTVVISSVTITPATLPDWTVNKSGYSQTLTGNNGTGPYSFAVTAGALPTGLTLAGGLISGTPTVANTFNFTITATDSTATSGSQAYTVVINPAVTVSPASLPNWTVNKTGYSQTVTSANGTGARTLSISAGAIPTGMTFTPATGVLNGTPTATGTFNFTITATDSVGATGAQAYTIIINAAVTVSPASLPDWTVNKTGYTQTVTGANGTGAKTLSISAGAVPTGMTFTPATGVLSGTPTATGTFNFTVTATDTVGATGSQAYTVVINAAVTVSPASLPDWTVNKTGYTQTVTSANGTGAKTLSISAGAIPTGMTFTPATGVLNGTPTSAGTFNFTITATDAVGATGLQAYTVVINPAVTVSPASLPNWTVNKSGYSQTVTSANGTGARTLSISAGAIPTGMAFTPATGVLNGTPTSAGTFNFTITATDTVGATGSQAYTVVINPPVSITTASLPNWTVNKAGYSQTITNTGGTGASTFAITAGTAPTGLTLGAGGLLSGTPTATGTFNFTVTATDTVGATGTQAYTVVINPPVSITTASLPDWTVNKTGYSQAVAATGGTGAKTFAVTAGAIPTGMTLSAGGLLSGTPTVANTFNFTITATDTVGATGSQAYTVVINPAVSITTATLPNWTQDFAYTPTVAATGGTGAKTFAVTSGAIPIGLTLNSNGSFSGAPSTAGGYSFSITATDTVGATAVQAYNVTINPSITVSPATVPNGQVNVAYPPTTISASGGTGGKNFSITAGSIPNGMNFNTASGLLDGTPTVSGSFTFTITSTDSIGATGSRTYTIVTNRPPAAGPVFAARSPAGSVKIPVAQIIAAAPDPDAGDIVTLVSVGNPTTPAHGTAVISGANVFYTPTAGDTNPDTFSYTVTDNHGAQATSTVTITVTGSNGAVASQITKQTRAANGTVSLSFAGVPGYTVGLQFTSDLMLPWVNLGPLTMNAVGQATFTDSAHPLPGFPNVFYRLIYPAP